MLLDPENVGVAFGISSLSGIEAEILRYFICTSGYGGHLCFTAHADIAQCEHESLCVLWPQKCRFGFKIPVVTLYGS